MARMPTPPSSSCPARPSAAIFSCTIFLNDPEDYDGGELHIRLGDAELTFKLKPGEAIVYPSDTLHQVVPVTNGERLVAITFIQSRIQDPFRRNMLFELNEVAALEGLKMDPENFGRLQLDPAEPAALLERHALTRLTAGRWPAGGSDTCSWTIFQLPSLWRWNTSVKRALIVGRAVPDRDREHFGPGTDERIRARRSEFAGRAHDSRPASC